VPLAEPSARRAPPMPPDALRSAEELWLPETFAFTPVRTPLLLSNWENDLVANVELLDAELVPTPLWVAVTESLPENATGPWLSISVALAGETASKAAVAALAKRIEPEARWK